MRAGFFARADEFAATVFCGMEKFVYIGGERYAIFGGTFQMEKRFVLRGGLASFAQNESQSHRDNPLRRGVRDFVFVMNIVRMLHVKIRAPFQRGFKTSLKFSMMKKF